MSSRPSIRNDLRFDYDEHAWCLTLGSQMGRLELIFNNPEFDPQTDEILADTDKELRSDIAHILNIKGIELPVGLNDYKSLDIYIIREIESISSRHFSFYMIGMAARRI